MENTKKIVVSGIKPSGRIHIGNYMPTMNWNKLQDQKDLDCFFFLADWHSLTTDYTAEEKRQQILDLALDFLALGIDPVKCVLFVQSHVKEHAELSWIFSTITPVSYLERMTQYKDQALRKGQSVNTGLLTYPLLMAADILIYKGDMIPVGIDQVQHVELTRDIANFFNNRFGQYFPETKALLADTAKLRSLTEPTRKMSKSHGEKSCIGLTDSPEEILKKMKGVPTEATGIITMSEKEVEEAIAKLEGAEPDERLKGMAGVWNLIQMVRIFGSAEEAEAIVKNQPIRYGDLKKRSAELIANHFADFRIRREELAKHPEKVAEILKDGADKARIVAAHNLATVRRMVGLD